jgi:hypothetical protein
MEIKYALVSLEFSEGIRIARQRHKLRQGTLRSQTKQLRELKAIHPGHGDINEGDVGFG